MTDMSNEACPMIDVLVALGNNAIASAQQRDEVQDE